MATGSSREVFIDGIQVKIVDNVEMLADDTARGPATAFGVAYREIVIGEDCTIEKAIEALETLKGLRS